MIDLLTSIEPVSLISILVKTLTYVATLVAAGSVLALAGLRSLPPRETASLRGIAIFAAIVAAVATAVRLPIRASFLMGGIWDGAFDPNILSLVSDGPLGQSLGVRLVGLALILALLLPVAWARYVAVLGAAITAFSFALRGHALGDPRFLLAVLIALHILCLAFWLGVFAPLYRLSRRATLTQAGALAEEFGTKASWVLGLLVLVGAWTLWLLGGAAPAAVASPYGQMFALKLVFFIGVLGLAAVNKLRHGPALAARTEGAGRAMRLSLALEALLILAILLTTAALTTLSSPPSEMELSAAPLANRSVA